MKHQDEDSAGGDDADHRQAHSVEHEGDEENHQAADQRAEGEECEMMSVEPHIELRGSVEAGHHVGGGSQEQHGGGSESARCAVHECHEAVECPLATG